MATLEAKGKVIRRHKTAIARYKAWLIEHRDSTRRERIEMFCSFVDDEVKK